MKKILGNLYLLSKFSLSITLLLCLLGVLYILYVNYKNESVNSKNIKIDEERITTIINKNSELVNNIANKIKNNESSLLEIKKNIEFLNIQNKNLNISKLNQNINSLDQKFSSLFKEIQVLKNSGYTSSKINKNEKIIDNSKNEIIDLILIKYENNINFDKEIEYLKSISSVESKNILDKISILSIKTYKGHEYLKNIFNVEVNNYLKKDFNNDSNSIFSRIILPYIEVSPTSENQVTSDLILKIKEIKSNIENENIEYSLKNLQTINNYENIFKDSFFEIQKYISFKNELLRLR